jgi:predicted Rossmann fold nucleotide-binding protein DprA/Smf involved in DNA uptake
VSAAALRRAPVTLSLARLSRGGARLRDRLATALEEHRTRADRVERLPRVLVALAHAAPASVQGEARSLEARLEAAGIRVLGLTHPAYPETLARREDPPPALFVRGTLDGLEDRCLAVTGSRRADPWARGQARALGHLARRCGLTLVAGWTSRCEEVAVRGGLSAPGQGRVLLVQPYGPELGPGEGARVRDVVATGGAVLSAWPPGLPPMGRAHPRRSQVLAALADDLVVLQAGAASGALPAARHVLAGGGDVWVPAVGLEPVAGVPRGGEGVEVLRGEGARVYSHPLGLVLPDLPALPWRPRETRMVERHGPLAPDHVLSEESISLRTLERRIRQGWLHWTPDGRIGPGFEPILRAMTQRGPRCGGREPRGSASMADPRGSAAI